ncbi:B3 domain-containing transcription factor NGA2 [Cryptomeria japonica]|uniref:B3 domain-containing transcription factor NGA2 n=1 Tax=Cryptomeria japonica TaxID=3369 RepID=UPI0027DA954D|nr:B3 domain-containing transcription factor NGA2 [Cryptomeria japonica]
MANRNQFGNLQYLFSKELCTSDTNKLCRVIIPKAKAEAYILPMYTSKEREDIKEDKDLKLRGFDIDSNQEESFALKFLKSSKCYELKSGWSQFVQRRQLKMGDVFNFYVRSDTKQLCISCDQPLKLKLASPEMLCGEEYKKPKMERSEKLNGEWIEELKEENLKFRTSWLKMWYDQE